MGEGANLVMSFSSSQMHTPKCDIRAPKIEDTIRSILAEQPSDLSSLSGCCSVDSQTTEVLTLVVSKCQKEHGGGCTGWFAFVLQRISGYSVEKIGQ